MSPLFTVGFKEFAGRVFYDFVCAGRYAGFTWDFGEVETVFQYPALELPFDGAGR